MDKHAIIQLKNQGYSNREAARILKINRKTIAKYWNEYKENVKSLDNPDLDRDLAQEKIAKKMFVQYFVHFDAYILKSRLCPF